MQHASSDNSSNPCSSSLEIVKKFQGLSGCLCFWTRTQSHVDEATRLSRDGSDFKLPSSRLLISFEKRNHPGRPLLRHSLKSLVHYSQISPVISFLSLNATCHSITCVHVANYTFVHLLPTRNSICLLPYYCNCLDKDRLHRSICTRQANRKTFYIM